MLRWFPGVVACPAVGSAVGSRGAGSSRTARRVGDARPGGVASTHALTLPTPHETWPCVSGRRERPPGPAIAYRFGAAGSLAPLERSFRGGSRGRRLAGAMTPRVAEIFAELASPVRASRELAAVVRPAERLGVSTGGHLKALGTSGNGPPCSRVGRSVRYPRATLFAHPRPARYTSASQSMSGGVSR